MYDRIPMGAKPLWWEGLAGMGYAVVAVSAIILLFEFAQDDGSAAWRWALLVGVVVAFLIGAVLFVRWAGRHRRAVRGRTGHDATAPREEDSR